MSILLNKVYTNTDDAEFQFRTKAFCTLHLRGKLDSRFDHIPAISYETESGDICVMPVELFEEQFRLVNDDENYLDSEDD